jgi:tetratricopeptide (TPR) repeat protein
MRRNIFICLLLAGITLAIYWPARHYGIVYYDDEYFISKTPEINAGLNGHSLAWAFTGVVLANWHPVTNLTFLLTHQFWGENPGVEHLVNAVFHALNAALLFLALTQMTRSPWRCAVVAALFAWHPLRVESVAWISERKDVLCGFFFLLTLWAYARYAQRVTGGKWQVTRIKAAAAAPDSSRVTRPPAEALAKAGHASLFYGLALVFFALGLMSKPMIVTLPFVLLLLDIWPLGRVAGGEWRVTGKKAGKPSTLNPQLSTLLLEKWPFFALALGFSALTFWLQQSQAAVSDLSKVPPGIRFANIVASYLKYLGKTVWPADLAVIYPHPANPFTTGAWPWWEVAAGGLLLAGISILCWRRWRQAPWLAVGWFWFLGMMVPVIGMVQVGEQAMADRYTYLPLIGPVISVVWLAGKWLRRPRYQLPLAMACAAGLAALTVHQLNYWQNSILLFSHCIAVTGANPSAEFCLASGLKNAGETNAAMTHYRIALALNPSDNQARDQIGLLLMTGGHWTEAETLFDEVLSREPGDCTAHTALGEILPQLGRPSEAITHLEAALRSKPDGPEALNNLAWMLATGPEGDLRNGPRAVELAERACELTHYQKTIYPGTLAAAYAEAGRFDDAMAAAQKAIALAQENGEKDLLQKNQELLERYRRHQTARE